MNELKPLRVLVVESTMFGFDGISNVVANYYKYQDHNRIHMDLVTLNSVDDSFKEKLSLHGSYNYILPYRNQNPFKYILELISIIKKGQYQIVHVHGCSATMAVEMLAAKIAGVKIRISHSHNTKCDHIKADKILRPFFYLLCNVGFACGKEAGEWMFPSREFSVISNGIDLEKFQYNETVRNEMRKENGLEGKFVLGHVGRFSKQKNHEKLIDIFSEMAKIDKDAKLVLVGDGELKTEIQKRVEKEELDVIFVGTTNEVEKWLQAMDVLVFPSLFEGLPLVLIEAQASGLPCVLSDTVSPETKITDLVEFVNLDKPSGKWVQAIEKMRSKYNRSARTENVKEQIKTAHFDIKMNCQDLAQKYEAFVCDGGKK